ncbi:MAG: hypothetical protein M0Q23_07865 [Syntrophales bacterium]|jgi:hypothetical protein|nr:hypothetical protein [Syntrophales bacterium]MCK9528540.1 hypothetical protein [Syntrophales bacterium]MDX9922833.1 hypothetical protein [Syntrophales bacterium]
MTHEDAGNYAGKHPKGSEPDRRVAEVLEELARDGTISCANAFKTAARLNRNPADVGMTIDLLEYRISRCQLGLFGYGSRRRIVEPAAQVRPEMKQAIEEALEDGRISCAACWEVARRLGCARMDVASACEALAVKISVCQLGSF